MPSERVILLFVNFACQVLCLAVVIAATMPAPSAAAAFVRVDTPEDSATSATHLGTGTPAFQMERQVIAPGGGRASGDGWQLDGTLGQVAAGRATGGSFTLDGGYWTAEALPTDIFSNGFEDTP